MILYPCAQRLVRLISPFLGTLEVMGEEHVPKTGPFILIANHQSIVDPILIQAVCPRPLHTMTKSTQFAHPLMRALMPRLLAFPVKRFQVDPQSVRIALRRLREGEGVGIYPEGERSWDGRLQPLRRGTVRLVLKSDVPIVPCRIDGSYHVLPRWSGSVRRGLITIRFRRPMRLGPHPTRRERELALEDATRILAGALEPAAAAKGPPDDDGFG